jgi:tRNA threonylcarbamoyladenosine modification (KEOPS) complex  Pcc1 subunit
MITLELRMEYDRKRTADAVYSAIGPDNEGYVRSELQGKTILFFVESETAGSMKNTVDDLLACVKAAEESSGLVPGPAADLDGDSLFE